ncbi:iron ABC transporter permease [Acidisoma cellulosilytica]|uniref:Iron ABC transporter permease n=1 Tax=Acidisoma cellulosilyticum TaxID=2802395 RepID=A0A963Z6Y7_9PROT|nr:iron ABC transporter permease [Acidisoma cellulosilyticum]MCB8883646.1 iron ABC transporter permease [Acidisoma cellulosilyticum]
MRWKPSRPIPAALLAAALLASLLVLAPIGWTAVLAWGVGAAGARMLLFRPLVGELLVNTLALISCTAMVATVIATAAAWCVERTDLPGRHIWAVLAVVPLALPSFITSFAWVSLSPALQDFGGALLVVTSSYFPLIYLPVAAALRSMDPSLEETARSLGLGLWQVFARVTLPHLRPALLGGILLVALNTLTEFGAFALLRFRTLTTEIFAIYRTSFDNSEAALFGILLILLCVLCLMAESWSRRQARYDRIARGVVRPASRVALGRLRLPVLAGFGMLSLVTLGVPFGMILYWLTQHNSAATSVAAANLPDVLSATWASLRLALGGTAVTMALALPLGFLATRYDGRLVALLERTAYLSQGMPGIVLALAMISITITLLRPLYQSAFLLMVVYAVLFLPLALVSVRAAFGQVQRGLEEAGRAAGLGWFATVWRVLLPLAGPGLGAAAAMVFVSVITELTATLLMAPIGTRTLAVQVWANTTTLAFAAAAPYAALMAALSLLSAWVLARRFGLVRGV